MTKEEKFGAINSRLGNVFAEPREISTMVVLECISSLNKMGILEGGQYEVTDIGSRAASVAQEFDWRVTDKEILETCEFLCDEDVSEISSIVREMINCPDKVQRLINNIKNGNEKSEE